MRKGHLLLAAGLIATTAAVSSEASARGFGAFGPVSRPMPVLRPMPTFRPAPMIRPAVYHPMPVMRSAPALRAAPRPSSPPRALYQHPYSPGVRQAVINYQSALTNQRSLYYQHDASMGRLARALDKTSQVGDLASAMATAVGSRGSLGKFTYDMSKDYLKGKVIQYGANRIFSVPSMGAASARFWGY